MIRTFSQNSPSQSEAKHSTSVKKWGQHNRNRERLEKLQIKNSIARSEHFYSQRNTFPEVSEDFDNCDTDDEVSTPHSDRVDDLFLLEELDSQFNLLSFRSTPSPLVESCSTPHITEIEPNNVNLFELKTVASDEIENAQIETPPPAAHRASTNPEAFFRSKENKSTLSFKKHSIR